MVDMRCSAALSSGEKPLTAPFKSPFIQSDDYAAAIKGSSAGGLGSFYLHSGPHSNLSSIKCKQTQVTESLVKSKATQNTLQATIMRLIVVHLGLSEKTKQAETIKTLAIFQDIIRYNHMFCITILSRC